MTVLIREEFKDIFIDKKETLSAFMAREGAAIHHGGTLELQAYENEQTGQRITLRLDVLEDMQTPCYHVKGNTDDDYLEIYPTFTHAHNDFTSKIQEIENTTVSNYEDDSLEQTTEPQTEKAILDKEQAKEELIKLMNNGKEEEAQVILNFLLRCAPLGDIQELVEFASSLKE